MDLEVLGSSPIGQLVPIEGQDQHLREFSYFAYLPDPLPNQVPLDSASWTKVAEASEALGRLAQACATLPNPGLLIAPALAREAVDTSALEGTYGALADVLEARISDARPSSPEVAEIRAYELVAHRAFEWVASERPITVGLLSDLQAVLAEESKDPQVDPGRVRQHQVVIGPKGGTVYEARYVPPPPDDRLVAGLDQWQSWIEKTTGQMPPVLAAALAHYQFESLHPFGDGNGRLGRLIIVLQLLRLGALPEPAITVSPWLRKRRDEYQAQLLRLSQTGEWDPWVTFFCQGICDQARASVAVVDVLNGWVTGVRQQLYDRHWTGTISSICEDLVDWPVISSPFVQKKYGVTAPTAKSAIDRLCELRVLTEVSENRYRRLYGALDVIKAVESL